MRRLSFGLLLPLSFLLLACGNRVYEGTKIPKTPENQEILDIVSSYQKAMEARDANLLLSLASPNYYEDAGTLDESDDYGIDGLRKVLSQRFSAVEQIRYTVRVKDIQIHGDKAYVDIHYTILFEFKVGDTKRWHNAQDDNRLELERIDGQWKIYAGM